MEIEVSFQTNKADVSEEWIRSLLNKVLVEEGCKGKGTISVVLVDNNYIKALNSRFLDRDCPTDVLSFILGNRDEEVWGEIYVSDDMAREQSEQYNVEYKEELSRLLIHGLLHLMGYDDSDRESREYMMQKEDYYLNKVGINRKH